MFNCLVYWAYAFVALVAEWDQSETPELLPLQHPSQAGFRLAVRNLVDAQASLRRELPALEGKLSGWDVRLPLGLDAISEVGLMLEVGLTQRVIEHLVHRLTKEDIAPLWRWDQCHQGGASWTHRGQ